MTHSSKLTAVVAISICLFAPGCSKNYLDVPPLGSLSAETISTPGGARALLIGAYSILDNVGGAGAGNGISGSNWVFGGIASDDAYKGSTTGDLSTITAVETYASTPANSLFNMKWRILYDGIQRANEVLRILQKVEGMTEQEKLIMQGEARFLRAHYHFEAKKMWNMVPFVDETITYDAQNYRVKNDTDIWPKIEDDFSFAIDNLPRIQSAVGRANKWAAIAYMGKVKLYQHKYEEARSIFEDVILNGVTATGLKYALVPFSNNFNAETKNSSESIFSVQMSVNDNANGQNGNRGDRLNGTYNGGPRGGSGFYQPSQSLVNSFRVDANGLPFLDNFNDVDVRNDQGLRSADPFTIETAPLDPRIDWTIGRRGIPYLDWGLHPGYNWIREQSSAGPYSPVKNIYYKRQEGVLSEKASSSLGVHSANNYTVIRFADVILMAAEAEAEAGTLGKATQYVNMVRGRMIDPAGWVHTYIDNSAPEKGFTDIPAANYNIGLYPDFVNKEFALKAIRFERKLELAMEGHRFFDLVRYGIAKTELDKYINKEKTLHSYYNSAVFDAGKDEYFPIPQAQIDLSLSTLQQNPGY